MVAKLSPPPRARCRWSAADDHPPSLCITQRGSPSLPALFTSPSVACDKMYARLQPPFTTNTTNTNLPSTPRAATRVTPSLPSSTPCYTACLELDRLPLDPSLPHSRTDRRCASYTSYRSCVHRTPTGLSVAVAAAAELA